MSKTAAGLTMAGLGILGLFVAVMLAVFAFSARDDFGRLDIPGTKVLHFPEGKVSVTYEEHVSLGESQRLVPPGQMSVRIVPVGGGDAVGYTPAAGGTSSTSTNSARIGLGHFQSPAESDYQVSAAAPGAGPGPDLQFGRGFFYALFHGVPLFTLIGSVLLIAAGVMVSLLPEDERPAPATG